MSWHFSQALEAEYLVDGYSDGGVCVPSNSRSSHETCSSNGRTTVASSLSPSGTTSALSTADRGAAWWISSLVASRARTSVPQERRSASQEPAVVSGKRWRGSSVRFEPLTSSWKIAHCSRAEEWTWFSGIWPRWGMMQSGVCSEQPIQDMHTNGTASGYMPTILKTQILEKVSPMEAGQIKVFPNGYVQKTAKTGKHGSAAWPLWMLFHGVIPTPEAAEFFMGWPTGWTDLRASGTDKFRLWLHEHGRR